jgi:hypothetical protein
MSYVEVAKGLVSYPPSQGSPDLYGSIVNK